MRIAVLVLLVMHEPAVRLHLFEDERARFVQLHAADERRIRQEAPVVPDRIRDRQVVELADREVLETVARRGVHGAGAGFERDVLAENDRHLPILERMLQLQAFERLAVELRERRAGDSCRSA